jgi:hypothetical protein
MDHITISNSELQNYPVATSVGAGINVIRTDWDWNVYTAMASGVMVKSTIACPVCERQKSKAQIVCQVCFQNILDSRNGAYPDRWSKVEQSPTTQAE